MNSSFTVRSSSIWAKAAPLLISGLVGCGHTPETATTTAPVAAPAPAAAPVAAPAPVAASAPTKAAVLKGVPKVKSIKPVRPVSLAAVAVAPDAPAPVATPAAAPEPVAAAPATPTTHTQAGRVLDESGRPLVGATVMLRGSTKGTSTDANGSYTMEVPNGENTFVVGYGGYEDETASSRDGQPLNVTLLPSPTSKPKGRRGRR